VAVTDPVDARLLAALAEVGKVAVHELAAKVGMDPREVAYRLVALSGSGLPLLVGVESDPNGLRAALWPNRPPQQPALGTPSGGYNVQGGPSGAHNVPGTPSGRHNPPPAPPGPQPPLVPQALLGPPTPPPMSRPVQRPQEVATQQFAPTPPADPVISTWGPPQSASWARGDDKPAAQQSRGKRGRTGEVMETQGLEGEQLTLQLLEVQDPADFLFSAAGYRLEEGERAVVVHTEITNRGAVPFVSLPDNYLELMTVDGKAVGKAPISLTSRRPHKIGVAPGETLGGHTVYVLPDATRLVSVRWSPRPEPDERTLTWAIED
jgi:DNA-binding Lrp family transcriptional regulator